jgi:hypothetical protein
MKSLGEGRSPLCEARNVMQTYCREVGVVYRHPKDNENPELDELAFHYRWEHLTEGASGERRVFILGGEAAFYKLLAHWNRQAAWKYSEK